MLKPLARRVIALAGILPAACWSSPLRLFAQLTPAQADGKQIYSQGTSSSGKALEAILGEGSTRVPATLMLCASCHGSDGKGRPEGGVVPSEITWDKLFAPIRKTEGLGRHRQAYNLMTLRRAIVAGTDPTGQPLGATMPRYPLPAKELNNLIQYLKILGRESSPGLTATTLRVGSIVPASGPFVSSGKNAVALLNAYFEEVNRQGGVYGRRLELYVMEASGTPAEIERKAESFVREQNIFAMLGILAPGAGPSLADLMERLGVPTVGAFALSSEKDAASQSKSFYVLSGLSQQARVLVKFARDHVEDPASNLAVVYPESMEEVAGLTVSECSARSLAKVTTLKYSQFAPAEVAETLAGQNVKGVFFLGRGKELQAMLAQAAKLNWTPTVFQPGPLAGEEVLNLSPVFEERVFLSFPTLPSDLDPLAIGEYKALAIKHNLAPGQPALSFPVLASAKVLIEALRRSGRQLDRDKFITTLSSIYDFNTGLTPPVTYGTTRRIGALGAYIVKLDLKNRTLAPADAWMVP
jgi:ABC-type branched-subunit amino acid transport system substrate-binding protein